MTTIAVVLASTRPDRVGEAVAHWVLDQTATRTDARFELVDLTAPQGHQPICAPPTSAALA